MYYLYEKNTGKLLSNSSMPIDVTGKTALAVVESGKVGIWNTKTLDMEPVPAQTRITKQEFYERFGITRLHALRMAAVSDPMLATFLTYMQGFETVNLKAPDLVNSFAYLKAKGLLTDADIAEITNG